MKNKDRLEVSDTLEQEGFHYAFMYYSDFSTIQDKEFHELRKAYIDACKKLEKYIGFGND